MRKSQLTNLKGFDSKLLWPFSTTILKPTWRGWAKQKKIQKISHLNARYMSITNFTEVGWWQDVEKPGYRTCAVMKPWTLKYGLYSHRTIYFIAKCENAVASAEYETWVLALGSLSLGIFKNVLDNLQASMNFILVIYQKSYYVQSSITHKNTKYLYLM